MIEENSEDLDQKSEESEVLPTGKERILFVDDEEEVLEVARRMLERLGYNVTTTTSPIKALDAFQVYPEDYDLVITDMIMPEMTGDVFAAEIVKIRPEIPVILCTGYNKMISDERAAEVNIRVFYMKPLDKRRLAKVIRKVLDEY